MNNQQGFAQNKNYAYSVHTLKHNHHQQSFTADPRQSIVSVSSPQTPQQYPYPSPQAHKYSLRRIDISPSNYLSVSPENRFNVNQSPNSYYTSPSPPAPTQRSSEYSYSKTGTRDSSSHLFFKKTSESPIRWSTEQNPDDTTNNLNKIRKIKPSGLRLVNRQQSRSNVKQEPLLKIGIQNLKPEMEVNTLYMAHELQQLRQQNNALKKENRYLKEQLTRHSIEKHQEKLYLIQKTYTEEIAEQIKKYAELQKEKTQISSILANKQREIGMICVENYRLQEDLMRLRQVAARTEEVEALYDNLEKQVEADRLQWLQEKKKLQCVIQKVCRCMKMTDQGSENRLGKDLIKHQAVAMSSSSQ